MKKRKIFVTEKDKTKLKKLFASTVGFRLQDLKTVKDLLRELDRAEVIDEDEVDGKVVTMNSTVMVKDLVSGTDHIYTIVFPEEADISKHKISILAPVGTALLGFRAGDTIEWEVPGGRRKLKVKKILPQQIPVTN